MILLLPQLFIFYKTLMQSHKQLWHDSNIKGGETSWYWIMHNYNSRHDQPSCQTKHFHIAQTEHWHVQDELMKCLKPVFYQEHKDIYSGLHSLHSRPDLGRHWLASFHSLIPANGLITTHTKHIKEKPDRMSTSGHATDCHTWVNSTIQLHNVHKLIRNLNVFA